MLTDKEFHESLLVADVMSNSAIAAHLVHLAEREKTIIESNLDPELRELLVHNLTVLVAAASRLGYSFQPEELADNGEL